MRPIHAVLLLAVIWPVPARAQTGSDPTVPLIATHDNVRSAGRLQGGVLSLSLSTGVGRWYPEGPSSKARRVAAFGEEGGPLSIPGPLVRLPQGTVVHATIHNTLASPMRVHGLCDRPGACDAPVTVAVGASVSVQFALRAAGTFHYWADTSGSKLDARDGDDSQLGGAIVVDPVGADVRDRVFVLGLMVEPSNSSAPKEVTVINGRSWPLTERLEYATGDSVRWRVVNLTNTAHPLHLHGFYFDVERAGDGVQDTERRDGPLVVTERVPVGGTRTLTWIPDRPGNWLFHCHMLVHHMLQPSTDTHTAVDEHAGDSSALGMQGLVLGIHVTGTDRAREAPDRARRQLQLIVSPDSRRGAMPSYRVDVVDAAGPPPRVNTHAVPGPVIVLTRGDPVAIDVINRLNEPTAIHWHGIELESRYDGVPDLSGTIGSVTPPIAPGGAFTALFTPPRAGTFMYHTHWHNSDQLAGGVYGPLIVLEPGQTYDPTHDHIIVLGLDGPYREFPDEPFVVNGETKPAPLELAAGVSHRLRFIGITADNPNLTVQLLNGFDPIQWTLVAKDGADVPVARRSRRPARQGVAVGETYDFELAPMPPTSDGLWFELRRGDGELLFQWPVRIK